MSGTDPTVRNTSNTSGMNAFNSENTQYQHLHQQSPQQRHQQRHPNSQLNDNSDILKSFEASFIFWFNNNLQLLFKEHLKACPPITQTQISKNINERIPTLIDTLSIGQLKHTDIYLFSQPDEDTIEAATFHLLKQIRESHFSALLHFNIRFARLFELNAFSLALNPIEPYAIFNLFNEALKKTIINQANQNRLLKRFTEIMADSFFILISENNFLLSKPKTTTKDINTSESSSLPNQAAHPRTDKKPSQHLCSNQESIAASGEGIAEHAMKHSTEAVTGIINSTPIPNRIHPLIREWEKYLFKLDLTKGSDSIEWSRALRTLVGIRRLSQKNKQQKNKQAHLDNLSDILSDCRKGLAYSHIHSDKIEALIEPFEEICVMSAYNKTLPNEQYSQYGS